MRRYATSTRRRTGFTGVPLRTARPVERIVPVVGMTTASRMSTFQRLVRAHVAALPIQRSPGSSKGTTVLRELCFIVTQPSIVADWDSALTWSDATASHGASHHVGRPTIRIRWSKRLSGPRDMLLGFDNIERAPDKLDVQKPMNQMVTTFKFIVSLLHFRSRWRANHAHRTRPSRHCYNPHIPWAGSLRLGR
jgi:hypothetical protein